MYTDLIFVCYITAICLSLLCLALIALVLVHKDYRDNKAFVAARNFAGTVILTGLLYFVFYYREMVRDQYELFLPFRIADYVLCCLLILFWLVLVFYLMDQEAYEKLLLFSKLFTGVRLAASLIITTGFMGPYYDINASVVRGVWTVLEALFTVVTVLLLVAFALMGLKECISRLRGSYILVCSLLLGAWSIIQCVVDAGLFFGKYGMSAWLEECPDLTGLILFLCSLSTFLFVFTEDFSPLFLRTAAGWRLSGMATRSPGQPRQAADASEKKRRRLLKTVRYGLNRNWLRLRAARSRNWQGALTRLRSSTS